MTRRGWWLAGGVVAAGLALVAAAAVWGPPWLRYRVTGDVRAFNLAVSRSVPKGSALATLEGVVGRGRAVDAPGWVAKDLADDPAGHPDGVRGGDTWVRYDFPDRSTWFFQVRDGRLVNYDPAVLAVQPQDAVMLVRSGG